MLHRDDRLLLGPIVRKLALAQLDAQRVERYVDLFLRVGIRDTASRRIDLADRKLLSLGHGEPVQMAIHLDAGQADLRRFR